MNWVECRFGCSQSIKMLSKKNSLVPLKASMHASAEPHVHTRAPSSSAHRRVTSGLKGRVCVVAFVAFCGLVMGYALIARSGVQEARSARVRIAAQWQPCRCRSCSHPLRGRIGSHACLLETHTLGLRHGQRFGALISPLAALGTD